MGVSPLRAKISFRNLLDLLDMISLRNLSGRCALRIRPKSTLPYRKHNLLEHLENTFIKENSEELVEALSSASIKLL